jgi:uncharacterized membrane protein
MRRRGSRDAFVPSTGGSTSDGARGRFPDPSVFGGIVDRNIEALVRRREQAEREAGNEARLAGAVTRFTGSMRFVYLHLAIFGGWIVWNLGVLGVPEFDESFVVLAMVASVEAIFLSTFVLISQNRMQAQSDERADLNVQISLLAEHEVTRVTTLVTAIARAMGLPEADDPELEQLQQDVRPEAVLDALNEREGVGERGAGGRRDDAGSPRPT